MNNILFTLNTVLPVFIIIFIGYLLKRAKFINENFISISSNLVFKIALPSLVFIKVSNADIKELAVYNEIIFAIISVTVIFFLSMIFSFIFIKNRAQTGVFAHGISRGNYGIVALSLLFNMMGDAGMAKGAIVLAVVSPLYNIYGTIALIIPQQKLSWNGLKTILIKIITNPIIISLLLSFIVLLIKWFYPLFSMPKFINTTINNFSALSMPVALIGIGGSLSLSHIKNNKLLVLLATLLRLVFLPSLFTIIAIFLGFKNEGLAALYMLFAVPTAVASFVFAKSMNGDSDLAANIIVTTTAGSVITISIGIFILKVFGLV